MASIAFVPWPEIGHILPLLKLAKRLRARGHRVFAMGLADFAPIVGARGLDFAKLAEGLFPEAR